jgi:membrane protease YdiL (CAAX protease family)
VKRRYSGRQLILAKCTVVCLIAFVAGPRLANHRSEIPITILAVLALLGATIVVYEALSRGLAVMLARLWDDTLPPGTTQLETDSPHTSPRGALRRRDVVTALLIFLGAEAAVWTAVGIVAALRVGKGGDHGALLQALMGLVPVALPGSLLAGGIGLLLVLRHWRQKLGPAALANLLGLSSVRPGQIRSGILAGAALALLILPLMGLIANPDEPPDMMTQLAGSSNAALRAWILSAVLLAPPIEELMFRGVLLGGLAETWSIRAAAVISGVTFWLMHGPEFVHWPAAVAIALLTVLATWLRVRSGSLGSSIGAHFGYNLVLSLVVWLAMTYGPGKSRWARDHQLPKVERAARSSVDGIHVARDI